ncbi:hypothetical protein [Paucisalibacillus sp. EB02]|uniref:hypothetical protein n=1 Tax=Paucisalibacillus sp. EB02 TaxID=1347087 RepID=UPI0004B34CE5|nr:hypothetical protein [Paucisalibacillus sp. EB02]
MRNIGTILVGLSLLTFAVVILLSNIAEAILFSNGYGEYLEPVSVYILISIVLLLGVILLFKNNYPS